MNPCPCAVEVLHVAGTLLITATAGVAFSATRRTQKYVASSLDARTRQVRRVQAHFDTLLRELSTGTPARLSDARAARRAQLCTTVRRYRDRAAFPRHCDFDAATPYSVNRKTGTLCAVAHLLLASTARDDIVPRAARTNSNVRAADLTSDTGVGLVAWRQ